MLDEHHSDALMMRKFIILLAITAAVTKSMARTTVDLPDDLHERLQERALRNHRSVSAEVSDDPGALYRLGGSQRAAGTEGEVKMDLDDMIHGTIKSEMVCPHCQEKGRVRTKQVKHKKGISGGKAVGALLTGGLSILATGLSRKEGATQAHCENCGATWEF